MTEYRSASSREYYLKLWLDQVSQEKSKNQSTIRVRMFIVSGNYSFASYNITSSITIAGQTINGTTVTAMGFNQTITLIDKNIVVTHDSQGKLTANFTAVFNGQGGYSPDKLTITNSFKLTDIPRASTASLSPSTVELGQPFTINITKADPNFTHTIRYNWYGVLGTIVDKTSGTSASYTPPVNFASNIPSTTSGNGTIYVDTYSGTTLLGTNSYIFYGNVPASVVPSLTGFTLTDNNPTSGAVVTGGENFIRIMSDIKVNFGQTVGAYGSTITGYYAEIVGKGQTTTTNGGTLGMMNYTGTVTIAAKVFDSRNRVSNTITRDVTILDYAPPVLSFKANRSSTLNTVFTIARSAKISPLTVAGSQKNTMKLDFYVAPYNSNTYTLDNGAAGGSWTTLSEITTAGNLSGSYSPTSSWTVKGVLSDKFTSAEFIVNVGTEAVVYAYDQNGFGILKIREQGALDVGGNIFANGKQIQQLMLTTNDGTQITATGDLNNYKTTGFYMGSISNMTNLPPAVSGSHTWHHIIVQRHNDQYVLQQVIDFNGVITAFRVCCGGTWKGWQYLTQSTHPNLVNTGWISTGVSGVYYKQIGDLVTVKMEVTTTANSGMGIGSVPSSLAPTNGIMFRVPAWSLDQSIGRNLQINSDGSMTLLSTSRGDLFRAQISWTI
ncbi:DUF859 family phage minor structural protein [Streptococcus uberis]|uniref:DUF859 family phage minor structural protein n=1 Tax=Streptococcus uberis TaxID=1349 RepID=UPI001FF38939|nr:DUF859 family phage minor structural protein [Streptococcus uberis]MCK1227810.1 DUF859 domain-containing protein [Streptococcus uberis]